MKIILETERLILRELTIDDAQNFYDLNADIDVIKYTGDVAFQNVNHAQKFLKNYNEYTQNGYGRWAVIHKENGIFLGWCGLKFSPETKETDLGFRFFKKHWNKGFATESAKACVKYGFEKLNLERIIGRAMKENSASIAVLKKIGFQYLRDFDCAAHPGELYEIKK